MLRKDLAAGVNEVLGAIKKSSIMEALKIERTDKTRDLGAALKAFRDYSIAAQSFSPVARTVADTFNMELLEDTQNWLALITDASPGKMRLVRSITTMQSELPRLLALLHQDSVPSSFSSLTDSEHPGEANVVSVRISLVEDAGQFSTVQRVIDGLSACQEMYSALQRINSDYSTPLAIGAIDSGSDKSFDLFGAAELMKQFRELVVSIWGLVVFHREQKIGKRLELIAAALPILEQVNTLEQSGRLGREEAQIIRNELIDGTKKFVATGVVTEDLASHATYSPRALMAPEPKLLTGPASAPSAKPPSHQSQSLGDHDNSLAHNGRPTLAGLSEEDLDRLAEMLSSRDQGTRSSVPKMPDAPTVDENES
ncbi:hypothetical protein [Roseateles sp.]|uniref:hypothetical protein n=1 Tax=Roseateles sp. TaxID=1971397 RepID=UPI003D0E4051